MATIAAAGAEGFWRRIGAMLRKELLQLRRGRVTLATMVSIPLLQLIVFGYTINTTPRDLPTAVFAAGIERRRPLHSRGAAQHPILQLRPSLDEALASGSVLFAVEIPAGFERALRRSDMPALLVAADATDPVVTGPGDGVSSRTSMFDLATAEIR